MRDGFGQFPKLTCCVSVNNSPPKGNRWFILDYLSYFPLTSKAVEYVEREPLSVALTSKSPHYEEFSYRELRFDLRRLIRHKSETRHPDGGAWPRTR